MTMHTPDDPDLQAKRGLNHEEWFLREVDKGIAAADRGNLVDHSALLKLIGERYPG
jgi:predicted transcriptional regulator